VRNSHSRKSSIDQLLESYPIRVDPNEEEMLPSSPLCTRDPDDDEAASLAELVDLDVRGTYRMGRFS